MTSDRSRPRMTAVAAAAAVALAALLAIVAPTGVHAAAGPEPAAASALPGGKPDFVVSMGSFHPAALNNWVRLMQYTFATDGTVSSSGWVWQQRKPNPFRRVSTGTTPDGLNCSTTDPTSTTTVHRCPIQTVEGYLDAPSEEKSGTFTLESVLEAGVPRQVVHITWPRNDPRTESWSVTTTPAGDLARLDLRDSALATNGYGYGSTASFSTRRAMSSVLAYAGTLKLDSRGWSKSALTSQSGQVYDLGRYTGCSGTTWCSTYLATYADPKNSPCTGCKAGEPTSVQYYLQTLSSKNRRDTLWHWCTCLAKGGLCYSGNSHIKPLLQILDDHGGFRGWVGVEASFWPHGDVTEQDGTVRDARWEDMIGALRISDFR